MTPPLRLEQTAADLDLARARGAAEGERMLRRIRLAAGILANGLPAVARWCHQCGRTWAVQTYQAQSIAIYGRCPSCRAITEPPPPRAA